MNEPIEKIESFYNCSKTTGNLITILPKDITRENFDTKVIHIVTAGPQAGFVFQLFYHDNYLDTICLSGEYTKARGELARDYALFLSNSMQQQKEQTADSTGSPKPIAEFDVFKDEYKE